MHVIYAEAADGGDIADYFTGCFVVMPFAVLVSDCDRKSGNVLGSHLFKEAAEYSDAVRPLNIDREETLSIVFAQSLN
jgi:hypothetical protein